MVSRSSSGLKAVFSEESSEGFSWIVIKERSSGDRRCRRISGGQGNFRFGFLLMGRLFLQVHSLSKIRRAGELGRKNALQV